MPRMFGELNEDRAKGHQMREDLHEFIEKAYPDGFVFFYLDTDGAVRLSGSNMDKSDFLTAFYHMGLALSCLTKKS